VTAAMRPVVPGFHRRPASGYREIAFGLRRTGAGTITITVSADDCEAVAARIEAG
jgi:hypothetical protein